MTTLATEARPLTIDGVVVFCRSCNSAKGSKAWPNVWTAPRSDPAPVSRECQRDRPTCRALPRHKQRLLQSAPNSGLAGILLLSATDGSTASYGLSHGTSPPRSLVGADRDAPLGLAMVPVQSLETSGPPCLSLRLLSVAWSADATHVHDIVRAALAEGDDVIRLRFRTRLEAADIAERISSPDYEAGPLPPDAIPT